MARTAPEDAGTASFARFAQILGERSKSYVTQLKAEGRLVLTEDGKRVRILESIELIRKTADPSKAGVVARHAAARTASEAQADQAPVPAPASATEAGEEEDKPDDGNDGRYQHWRARSERAKALAAERDNRVRDGELLEARDVVAAASAATTTLRQRLESLADVLGPQLAAENDEARCRALVAEAVEHALDETSRQFAALAKDGTP
jgi:hypothetical protein